MAATKKTQVVELLNDLTPMLTRLKLTAIRDQLDTLLDRAGRTERNLRDALATLCAAEVVRKDVRRTRMGMLIAKFRSVRTLESFEYDAHPSVDPRQIRALATSRWVANGDSVLLLGPPGAVKTYLAGRATLVLYFPLRAACRCEPLMSNVRPRENLSPEHFALNLGFV